MKLLLSDKLLNHSYEKSYVEIIALVLKLKLLLARGFSYSNVSCLKLFKI